MLEDETKQIIHLDRNKILFNRKICEPEAMELLKYVIFKFQEEEKGKLLISLNGNQNIQLGQTTGNEIYQTLEDVRIRKSGLKLAGTMTSFDKRLYSATFSLMDGYDSFERPVYTGIHIHQDFDRDTDSSSQLSEGIFNNIKEYVKSYFKPVS